MSKIQTFDYSLDLLRVVPWQYEDAVRLLEWLQNKQNYANQDHTEFWEDWYNDVFNIDTCNIFGTNVWAIILDLPLLINQEPIVPGSNWGFGEFRKNFTNGNFIGSGSSDILTLDQRRRVLKMRYLQLISRGTVAEINYAMQVGWGDIGSSYVLDNGNMSITYIFEFEAEEWMTYAINTLQVLPRPSTVGQIVSEGWILETGFWNDNGSWDDNDVWNDGP